MNETPRFSRQTAIAATLILVFSVLPYLLLAPYAQPIDDDFCNAVGLRRAGSPTAYVEYLYQHKTGRLTSSALLASLNPLSRSSWKSHYVFVPIFAIVAMVASITAAAFSAARRQFRFAPTDAWIVSAMLTATTLALLPSPASLFFWFTGASVYTAGLVLLAAWLASQWILCETRVLRSLLPPLLGAALVGVNEVFIVAAGLVVLIRLFLARRNERLRIVLESLPLAMMVAVCVSAPGNFANLQVTSGGASGLRIPRALFKTILQTSSVTLDWLTSAAVVAFVAVVVLAAPVAGDKPPRARPVTVTVAGVAALCLIALPTMIAYNDILPRTWSVVLVCFMLGLLLIVAHYASAEPAALVLRERVRSAGPLALGIASIWILLSNDSSVARAYADWTIRAKPYAESMRARYAQLEGSADAVTTLKAPFKHIYEIPKTIYLSDVTDAPERYPNECLASYWGRESIVIDNELRLEPFHLRKAW